MEQRTTKPLSRLEAEEIFNIVGDVSQIYKEKIAALKDSLRTVMEDRDKWRVKLREVEDKDVWFVDWQLARHNAFEREIKKRMRKWKFFLRPIDERRDSRSFDLEHIKQIPIGQFLEQPAMSSQNRATYKCIFHNEKTASMVWYKDQNRTHCYGCSREASVVDVVMKLYDYDFKTACEFLSKY